MQALDYPENDIYLHIDKKTLLMKDSEIKDIIKNGTIHVFRWYSIAWGGDSQIKCELFLLREASRSPHAYYHFLSGVDIPLATQCDIHSFFEKCPDRNYIGMNAEANTKQNFVHRIRYYRIFQNRIGRITTTSPIYAKLLNIIESFLLKAQRFLHIDRLRANPYSLYKGSGWFSITHEVAVYLVSQRKKIMRYFGHSLGADEVFLQTMVMNSEFAGTVCQDNLRYIDWSDSDLPGAPKTLTMQDLEPVVNSGKLFARKFSVEKDLEIVRLLYLRLQ